jgi:hypothetical protein
VSVRQYWSSRVLAWRLQGDALEPLFLVLLSGERARILSLTEKLVLRVKLFRRDGARFRLLLFILCKSLILYYNELVHKENVFVTTRRIV